VRQGHSSRARQTNPDVVLQSVQDVLRQRQVLAFGLTQDIYKEPWVVHEAVLRNSVYADKLGRASDKVQGGLGAGLWRPILRYAAVSVEEILRAERVFEVAKPGEALSPSRFHLLALHEQRLHS